MTAPIYQHYLANLAGKKPPIHANEPWPGHYKRKLADGSWVAASIFPADTGAIYVLSGQAHRLACRVGNEMRDPGREWLYLAKHPIPEAAAFHFYQHGCWPADMAGHIQVADATEPRSPQECVPDGAPAGPVTPGVGDNSKTGDPFSDFLIEATAEIEAATRWIANAKIETQADADIAADKYSALRKLWNKADKLRKEEGEPHRDAVKAIDAKWREILTKLDETGRQLNGVVTSWMRAENERREAERRALEEKQRAEAEAAAARGEPVPEPDPIPEAEPVRAGGSRGRRVALATTKTLVVTDPSKVWKLVKSDPRVLDAIQRAATDLWRANGKVPAGCEIKETAAARA